MKTQCLTYQKWIKAAYSEFACCGPDFSLKALSGKANLPRATFYYHFDNKEHLTEELMNYHLQIVKRFHEDLKSKVVELIPDLYEVMMHYQDNVMFHQQLLKNNHVEAFNNLYNKVNNSSIIILLPKIRKYFNSDKSDFEIIEFYHTLTDAWYARISSKNLSVDYMCNLALDIMDHTLGLYQKPKVKTL